MPDSPLAVMAPIDRLTAIEAALKGLGATDPEAALWSLLDLLGLADDEALLTLVLQRGDALSRLATGELVLVSAEAVETTRTLLHDLRSAIRRIDDAPLTGRDARTAGVDSGTCFATRASEWEGLDEQAAELLRLLPPI